ncbi:MAG: helix-turn-helix transcriptional regulator [Pseudomonadales bacterium]
MPKQNIDTLTDFGRRLVKLRKVAGYTQVELAKELEVTQRMISHYEGHSDLPPSSILVKLVKVLGVTSDELLGIRSLKRVRQPDTRLQRRVQQIEKMDTTKKRQILQIIDTFIEAEQLRQHI